MGPLLITLGVVLGSGAAGSTDLDRYQAAVQNRRMGRLGPASEALELLSRPGSLMADRCAYEAGLLFERRTALHRADAMYARVSADSHFFTDARLALARMRMRNGDFAGAAAAVGPLASSRNPIVRQRGLTERLIIADRAHDEAGKLDAKAAIAIDRAPWLGGSPVLAVISGTYDRLLLANMCRDARRVARRASSSLGCVDRLFDAEALACRGGDSSEELHLLASECTRPEVTARAWMTLAVLSARDGKLDAAVSSFRKVAEVAPTNPLAAEALFAAFWVEWKASPEHASGEDLVRLETLPRKPSASDQARSRYWRAKLEGVHGTAGELALLTEVAGEFPATWYGHLARERLTELGADELPELLSLAPEADDAARRLAPGLAAMQLKLPSAKSDLIALARAVPSPEANRLVVDALERAGADDDAHRFARAVLRDLGGQGEAATVWEAAFPTHYSKLLASNGDESRVPPEFLLGLVREESAFNPSARSGCGARGLMQLMPATARQVARQQGSRLAHVRELYDPERNIQLGADYLGQLLKKFDNNRALAAAAYNGGPTRVARWFKLAAPGRMDEWVEELPLDETRNYLKSVVASADVYRHRLDAQAGGALGGGR